VSWIDELASPAGRELLRQLSTESLSAETELRTITRLRERHPRELVAAAVEQTKLRRRAAAKFSRASEMLFTRAGLEQASSERMAQHHASRYRDFATLADLCCGIGGDLIGLAAEHRVVAVDTDAEHLALAQSNARVYGVADRVRTVCADVREADLGGVDAVFIDPARRTGEKRMRAGASEPPLEWCVRLADRVLGVGIKASPALPLEIVPADWSIEFVSEERELKESLLWSPSMSVAPRYATILPSETSLAAVDGAAVDVREPGKYLIDPDPAVTRAGLVEDLARTLGDVWKIDDQVAFLSTDTEIETDFGRTLSIEASQPWNLAALRKTLRALDVGAVDIRKRGSAVDVDDVRRRLKLAGERSATVVLTRVANKPWAFVSLATEG
jgi:hypothetical protein